jgi:hypothetical protein
MARSSSPPTSKFPANLHGDILNLMQILIGERQEAHAFFATKTRYAVGFSDPAERQRVQADLDHGVGLFCAAHAMALFEKKLPSRHWADIFDQHDLQRLKALRHLRRCAAKGFSGDRVPEDSAEFDAVMASSNPLRGVESFTADEIRLSSLIGINEMPFLQQMGNKALVATLP